MKKKISRKRKWSFDVTDFRKCQKRAVQGLSQHVNCQKKGFDIFTVDFEPEESELFIIRKCPSLAHINSQHEVRALTLQTQACMKFVLLSQIVLHCTTKHLDLTRARSGAFKMACCHCETTLSLRWSAWRRCLRNVVILTLLDLKSHHWLSVSYISGSVRRSKLQHNVSCPGM